MVTLVLVLPALHVISPPLIVDPGDPMNASIFFLHGTVVHADGGAPLAGLSVQVVVQESERTRPVAEASTAADGSFVAQLDVQAVQRSQTGAPTAFELRVYDGARRLLVDSGADRFGVDQVPAQVELAVTPVVQSVAAGSAPERQAHGLVRHVDGTPLAGLTVLLFHRSVGSSVPLGTPATTGSDGTWVITYGSSLPQGLDPNALMLYAIADDATEGTVGRSVLAVNAGEDETLDIDVPSAALAGRVEYAQVTIAVGTRLDGVDLATVAIEDVLVLHQELGQPREALVALVAARRLAIDSTASEEALYGWVRVGLPANLDRLSATAASTLEAALGEAVRLRYVQPSLATTAAVEIGNLGADKVARSQDATASGTLGALLATTSVSQAKRDAFVAAYVGRTGSLDDFWAAVRADAQWTSADIDELERAIQLGIVCSNHVPLVKAINAAHTGIAARAVADWAVTTWRGLLDDLVGGVAVSTPAAVTAPTESERRDTFADICLERAERAFANRFVVTRLRDELGSGDVFQFLTDNPDFDLRAAPIRRELDLDAPPSTTTSTIAGSIDPQAVSDALQAWQRLFRIGPAVGRFPVMLAVHTAGLTSAHRAVALDRTGFIDVVQSVDSTLPEETLDEVYDRAEAKVAQADATLMRHHAAFNRSALAVLGSGTAPEAVPDADVPDYARLFSAPSVCTCSHCTSIFGPGAYFADLLRWLDANGSLSTLSTRRPDLTEVDLGCRNAHTTMPYIDLTIEVLERLVILEDSGSPATLPDPLRSDRTAEELAAIPEHANPGAYAPLREAVYPMTLPYDLGSHLGRTALDQLGVPSWTLFRDARTGADPSDAQLSAERIGLTERQRALAGTDDGHGSDLWTLWGFAVETDGSDLWSVTLQTPSELLTRGGLTWADLQDLVHARSAVASGAALALTLESEGDPCAIDDHTVERSGGGAIDAASWEHIRRVVRLHHGTGMSWRDLDALLVAAGGGSIDATHVQFVTDAVRVVETLGLTAQQAAVLWAPLDTYLDRGGADPQRACLYDALFFDRTLPDATAFALNGARTDLASPVARQVATPTLCAVLGTSADAIQVVAPSDSLDLAGLSTIVRRVWLAQRLGVTPAALMDLLAASTIDPFASPQDTVTFVAQVHALRSGAGDVATALWLVSPAATTAVDRQPADADLAASLAGARAALASLVADLRGDEARPAVTLADLLRRTTELDGGGEWVPLLTEAELEAILAIVADTTQAPSGDHAALNAALDPLASVVDDLNPIKGALVDGTSGSASFETEVAARYAVLLDPLRQHLLREHGRDLLEAECVAQWGLSDGPTRVILDAPFAGLGGGGTLAAVLLDWAFAAVVVEEADPTAGMTRTAFPHAFQGWEQAIRAAALLAPLNLDQNGASFLASARASTLGIIPLTAMTWSGATGPGSVDGLAELGTVVEAAMAASVDAEALGTTLADLAAIADESGLSDADARQAQRTRLAEVLALPTDDLNVVMGTAFGYADRESVFAAGRIAQSLRLCGHVRRLGTSAVTVVGWADALRDPATPIADALDAADGLTRAARARFPSDWSEVGPALRNPVREAQQMALVDWLIADLADVATPTELYHRSLLDVQMSSCAQISRLVQATQSVQLFVHRAMMGFEAGVTFSASERDQWTWMKTYRIWEAARKVLVFPENWIEPELRDDKTHLFEALEQQLGQGELDERGAEDALIAYAEGLNELGRLRVVGTYQEVTDGDATANVLHVVARARSQPHRLYYIRRVGREWTPWEPVAIEPPSDHVMPVVLGGRIRLVWLEFAEQNDRATSHAYWAVSVGWTERSGTEWLPPRRSRHALRGLTARADVDAKSLHIARTTATDAGLTLTVFVAPGSEYNAQLGAFDYDACTDNFRVAWSAGITASAESQGLAPADLTAQDNGFVAADDATTLTVWDPSQRDPRLQKLAPTVLLQANVGGAVLAVDHQDDLFTSRRPFFVDLGGRTYLVEDRTPGALTSADVTTTDPGRVDAPTQHPAWQEAPVVPTPPAETAFAMRPLRYGAMAANPFEPDTSTVPVFAGLEAPGADRTDASVTPAADHRFQTFYHPFTCQFLQELRLGDVSALLAPAERGTEPPLARQQLVVEGKDAFETRFDPSGHVSTRRPDEAVSFSFASPFGRYNWELFFHAPMHIAKTLAGQHRYDEAIRWLLYVFDPANRNTAFDTPDEVLRYWKIKPFLAGADAELDRWKDLASTSPDEQSWVLQQELQDQIDAWRRAPFHPHAIARVRGGVYQRATVFAYLRTLINWADHLFAQDTMETVAEATNLYLLAGQIAGPRPIEVGSATAPATLTYDDVAAGLWATQEAVENTLVDTPDDPDTRSDRDSHEAFPALGLPHFCVPPNPKLEEFWDTLEDRLFKIRNCQNLQGQARQLALFQPPIDPALLVKAASQGLRLSSVLSDLATPLPPYRFTAMLQRAYAYTGSVRSLGQALLSAWEKEDGEALARLRNTHEVDVLEQAREVRKDQIAEARAQLAAVQASIDTVTGRQAYYELLLEEGWSPSETAQVGLIATSTLLSTASGALSGAQGFISLLPQVHTRIFPIPPAVTIEAGGSQGAATLGAVIAGLGAAATASRGIADMVGMQAGFARRAQEWQQQLDQAGLELDQLEQQRTAAEIRLNLAETELANHDRQIANAQTVRTFMERKFTNRELHQWMRRELAGLYAQSYQLAYRVAKQAQRSYRHEMADDDAIFVQYGHWDGAKAGLLAGERLQLDLERMEASYLSHDRREAEVTKHVSLAMLDGVALSKLRTEGACEFTMPEPWFDLDVPGHYLRRLKGVSVSIPCTAGPYGEVYAKLTLLSSQVRREAKIGSGGLVSDGGFVESILTSGGQDASGLFQFDFNDPRYLPFERRGAVSTWRLEFPNPDYPSFDWQSITDAIIHLRFTARDGGSRFASDVRGELIDTITAMDTGDGGTGIKVLVSARQQTPDGWHAFLNPDASVTDQSVEVSIGRSQRPYALKDADLKITGVRVVALMDDGGFTTTLPVLVSADGGGDTTVSLVKNDDWGGQRTGFMGGAAANPETLRLKVAAATVASAPGAWKAPVDGVDRLRSDALLDLIAIVSFTKK